MHFPLAFLSPSFGEIVLIAIIALLLYGSDLPEVARTWGKAYQEFRRNLNNVRNDLNNVIYSEPESPRKLQYYPEFQQASAEAEAAEEAEAKKTGESKPSAAATADAASEQAEIETTSIAGDATIRRDAHGAA